LIRAQPQVPFLEFHWGSWLRRQGLPPFTSQDLIPALPRARSLVRTQAGQGGLPAL
jgi:hypothetical protein